MIYAVFFYVYGDEAMFPKKPFVLAFTLVEILVVITVTLVLVMLSTLSVNMLMTRAQGAVCAEHMRQVGAALLAYRAEHNGWFSPNGPIPSNGGSFNMNNALVPDYLKELPICPGAKKELTSAEDRTYGSNKVWWQKTGGSYALNFILAQWKLEAMPAPTGWMSSYSASRMPLLLETYYGSSTWALNPHQNPVLRGFREDEYPSNIKPRYHGKKDALNFMFVDGHIELISRNDPRDVPETQKSWVYPTNPNGRFSTGRDGRLIQTTQLTNKQFEELYGER